MGRSRSDRVKRATAAGIVLLAHVVLIWLFLLPQVERIDRDVPEAVIATFIEQPRPRNHSLGPISVQMTKTKDLLHLQRLAPKIQDVRVDEPEPTLATITVPVPASAPLPELAKAGMNGESDESTGESGGGMTITLLQRVIPRYPESAARHQQEGLTGVLMRVDPSGRVRDVKVTRSSGVRSLDDAAVDAFRKWKFAPIPASEAPDGVWLRTEQRFILYRFRYSRLGDRAAEQVNVHAIRPGTDTPTPGSQAALRQFLDGVRSGTYVDDDARGRIDLAKMRDALEAWGAVKSIHFTGIAGSDAWTAYRVKPSASESTGAEAVEVKWNLFEVKQEHATTEWLLAVDRSGAVWAARASPAPWM